MITKWLLPETPCANEPIDLCQAIRTMNDVDLLRALFIYVSKISENESLPGKLCAICGGVGGTNFNSPLFSPRKSKYETKTQVQLGSVIYISVFELNDRTRK